MSSISPKLTVIVCTHNRSIFLSSCLRSLAEQTAARADFSVIIVDNGSTDDTKAVCDVFVESNNNFQYVYEPKLGLAKARNTGLALSLSPLVAYTDDDATPATDWVELMINRFECLPDDAVVLGGEIDPVWEVERPGWLSDNLMRPLSARLAWDTSARFLKSPEWVCEVNCCYRAELLREYGGFPETLGRKGDLLLSGENYVNEQMFADGLRAFFDPAIRVKHFIPKERLTKEWFMRRSFWQGVTSSVCAEYDHQAGRNVNYWQNVKLPSTQDDWWAILDQGKSSTSVEEGCALVANIGYVLGIKNMVIGR